MLREKRIKGGHGATRTSLYALYGRPSGVGGHQGDWPLMAPPRILPVRIEGMPHVLFCVRAMECAG